VLKGAIDNFKLKTDTNRSKNINDYLILEGLRANTSYKLDIYLSTNFNTDEQNVLDQSFYTYHITTIVLNTLALNESSIWWRRSSLGAFTSSTASPFQFIAHGISVTYYDDTVGPDEYDEYGDTDEQEEEEEDEQEQEAATVVSDEQQQHQPKKQRVINCETSASIAIINYSLNRMRKALKQLRLHAIDNTADNETLLVSNFTLKSLHVYKDYFHLNEFNSKADVSRLDYGTYHDCVKQTRLHKLTGSSEQTLFSSRPLCMFNMAQLLKHHQHHSNGLDEENARSVHVSLRAFSEGSEGPFVHVASSCAIHGKLSNIKHAANRNRNVDDIDNKPPLVTPLFSPPPLTHIVYTQPRFNPVAQHSALILKPNKYTQLKQKQIQQQQQQQQQLQSSEQVSSDSDDILYAALNSMDGTAESNSSEFRSTSSGLQTTQSTSTIFVPLKLQKQQQQQQQQQQQSVSQPMQLHYSSSPTQPSAPPHVLPPHMLTNLSPIPSHTASMPVTFPSLLNLNPPVINDCVMLSETELQFRIEHNGTSRAGYLNSKSLPQQPPLIATRYLITSTTQNGLGNNINSQPTTLYYYVEVKMPTQIGADKGQQQQQQQQQLIRQRILLPNNLDQKQSNNNKRYFTASFKLKKQSQSQVSLPEFICLKFLTKSINLK
jgi:hypothetical protein